MSADASIAVVVLNYLNYDQTILCVRDLLLQDVSPRILIVDNHSPNDSVSRLSQEFTSEERVAILQTAENLGYAGGNNFGVRWLASRQPLDYVLIVNNDVRLPDSSTIRKLADFAHGKKDLGGVGRVLSLPTDFHKGPIASQKFC